MGKTKTLPKDPFSVDILCDPYGADYSIPGLHDQAFQGVLDKVEDLMSMPCPRYDARCEKALLVVSSQAGFGKSQLIGRLFHKLDGRVTRVYIRPFEDMDTSWKSLLMRVVQELDFPDHSRKSTDDPLEPKQLTLFAHGVLAHIVADFLEAGGSNLNMVPLLRGPVTRLVELKNNEAWSSYLGQLLQNPHWLGFAEGNLREKGVRLNVSLSTWLKVFHAYAYQGDDRQFSCSIIDWILGGSINQEVVDRIGISARDVPMSGASSGLVNEICKMRVMDLCRLAGYVRPFLFCFDQIESYGKHPGLSRALGSMISELTRNAYNQLTLIAANLESWNKVLQPSWDEAERDCLSRLMMLDPLQAVHGEKLVENRLAAANVDAAMASRYWGNRRWLQELFGNNRGMGIRRFLQACSKRWQSVNAKSEDPARSRPLVPVKPRQPKKTDQPQKTQVQSRPLVPIKPRRPKKTDQPKKAQVQSKAKG